MVDEGRYDTNHNVSSLFRGKKSTAPNDGHTHTVSWGDIINKPNISPITIPDYYTVKQWTFTEGVITDQISSLEGGSGTIGINLHGESNAITINTEVVVDKPLHVNNTIWSEGSTGSTPASGTGTRFMWIPSKQAFRAGTAEGDRWDDANIGTGSFCFSNYRGSATGSNSFVTGWNCGANGKYGVSMGYYCYASGDNSVAIGRSNSASGTNAIAIGNDCVAGTAAIAIGNSITSSMTSSMQFGNSLASATTYHAIMIGEYLTGGSGTRQRGTAIGRFIQIPATDYVMFVGTGVSNGSRLTAPATQYQFHLGMNSTVASIVLNGTSAGIGVAATVEINTLTTITGTTSDNTAQALVVNDSSNVNLFSVRNDGYFTGKQLNTVNESVYLGNLTGVNDDGTANYNVGIGESSLTANTSGEENTATGAQSMYANTSGSYNAAYGYRSLYSNLTGQENAALGRHALFSNTDGSLNVAVGQSAFYSGTSNTYGVAAGWRAGYNANQTGGIFLGRYAGSTATGNYNVYIGYHSCLSQAAGYNNVALGGLTLLQAAGDNNEIVIGYNLTGNGSDTVTIGNASITNNYFQGDLTTTGDIVIDFTQEIIFDDGVGDVKIVALSDFNRLQFYGGNFGNLAFEISTDIGIMGEKVTFWFDIECQANIGIGSNYISNDGQNEGISIDTSGNVTLSDALTVGDDTDVITTLGRGKLGYVAPFADQFYIAHYDYFTSKDYALKQNNVGTTYINAKTGQQIFFTNNGSTNLLIASVTDIQIWQHLSVRSGKELRLHDNGNHVGFVAPALIANQIWTLPDADGNAGDALITDGAGALSWETNIPQTRKTAASMTVTTGTLSSGTVSDTQTWQDGNIVNISEVAGIPGFDVLFTFTSVTDFYRIGISAYYAGNHDCTIEIYDDTNTTWRILWDFSSGATFNYRYSDLPVDIATRLADYINGSSEVKIRFYHPSSGNPSDDLYIDYVSLIT